MTYEEMIMLEQYFRLDNVSFEEGMDYLKYMLNMKDFENPLFKGENHLKTELVILDFIKEKEGVYFSGAFTLTRKNAEPENRSITGHVYREKGRTIIEMDVFRHSLSEDDPTREYNVVEMFTPNKDKETYERYTSYRNNGTLTNEVEKSIKLSDEPVKEFIDSKTKFIKGK